MADRVQNVLTTAVGLYCSVHATLAKTNTNHNISCMINNASDKINLEPYMGVHLISIPVRLLAF